MAFLDFHADFAVEEVKDMLRVPEKSVSLAKMLEEETAPDVKAFETFAGGSKPTVIGVMFS